MTDAVWCILTRGITYSVSHRVGCRLVHPNTWNQLNAIRHHDGCRLVHPAKWDISSMPYAIMTDADWCIPSSGTLENSRCLRDGCRLVHPVRRFIWYLIYFTIPTDSVWVNPLFIIIQSHIYLRIIFQRHTQSTQSYHILIHELVSCSHS